MAEESVIHYIAPPTLRKFHRDDSLVRLVLGSIGSGKSVGMCAEIVRMSKVQEPNKNGIRKTRFAIVRNTIKELKDTTIKTWLDWYSDLGEMHWSNLNFIMKFDDVECEILFRSLDRPDQLKSLLSLELTGAFVNEAKEIQAEVIQTLISRLGRYPSKRDGGCTFPSMIMDSNFPSEDSFIYRMFEEEKPEGWKLFKQPPPLLPNGKPNPLGENIANLPSTYYTTQMAGKDKAWLRVYRDAQYGFVISGKAVYPDYNENIHLLESFAPNPKLPIMLGVDYGRTPVAVFGQKDAHGRWVIFDELQTWDMGATQFGDLLSVMIQSKYAGYQVHGWGDPAGDDRTQVDDKTPMMMLMKAGIKIRSAPTNDPFVRISAVTAPLQKVFEGIPAFRITPQAKMVRKAMAGGYQYKRMQVAGQARYSVNPDKNEYSHCSDALQYLLCGGGEGLGLIRRDGSEFEVKASKMGKRTNRVFTA